MKTITYSQFELNNVTVFEVTEVDDNSVTISQSSKPFVDEDKDDDVTHGVFFGENIRRAIRILKR